jgi:uncharacterized protein YcbK (DUF882 family)
MDLKYFNLSEFDCPSEKGSGSDMDSSFLEMLERAREISGIPYKITSGVRRPERNLAIGGKPDSSHLYGFAADIAATDSRSRFLIVDGLLKAGFTRIGIAGNNKGKFIHVDSDPNKSPNVIWCY